MRLVAPVGALLDPNVRVLLARHTDPATSHTAPNRTRLTGHRLRVLEAHRAHPDGLTDFELAELTGLVATSAGKRRIELLRLGLVEATTEKRPSPSGSMAIVWRAS